MTQAGFEPPVFESRVRRSTNWATPPPSLKVQVTIEEESGAIPKSGSHVGQQNVFLFFSFLKRTFIACKLYWIADNDKEIWQRKHLWIGQDNVQSSCIIIILFCQSNKMPYGCLTTLFFYHFLVKTVCPFIALWNAYNMSNICTSFCSVQIKHLNILTSRVDKQNICI